MDNRERMRERLTGVLQEGTGKQSPAESLGTVLNGIGQILVDTDLDPDEARNLGSLLSSTEVHDQFNTAVWANTPKDGAEDPEDAARKHATFTADELSGVYSDGPEDESDEAGWERVAQYVSGKGPLPASGPSGNQPA